MRFAVVFAISVGLLVAAGSADRAAADRGEDYFFRDAAAAVDSESYRIKTQTREQINYESKQRPGTIIVDTAARELYFIIDGTHAMRYGIGVGREGFAWGGVERISRKAEWPGWTPPQEMRRRQPYLPTYMPGGPENPLGARALYLGATLYRIHGTNEAQTIGRAVSSGCIRMLNDDVIDLYERAKVGATVIVQH